MHNVLKWSDTLLKSWEIFREIFEANAGRVEYLSDKLKKQAKLVEERTENFIVEKNQRQLMFFKYMTKDGS